MSIVAELHARESEGRLHQLSHSLGLPQRRKFYVSPEVRAWIDAPWSSVHWEKRGNSLRADLDRFIAGETIIASVADDKDALTYIALLRPPEAGIWALRSLSPRPSIRILGAFAYRDTFVALVAEERTVLGGFKSAFWRWSINTCKARWRNLFPAYERLVGNHIHDFISTNVVSR